MPLYNGYTMLTPPPILPFKRLRIYDGLSIDADRWQSSHRYHRLRQNFHYQSLNQGGVVCGLGVQPILDPTQISNRSSADVSPSTASRWVRIQPGIAIDGAGNPIIVAEPITFQFQSELRQGETQTIYLVVNYRDPDDLRQMGTIEQDYVQELFRIQERTILDPILDVELCRIELSAGEVSISLPQDLMTPKPGLNCLDFNHREIAQTKPQSLIQVGLLGEEQNADRKGRWAQLLQSLPQLHTQISGAPEVAEISLLGITQNSELDRQHLLYIDQVTLLKQINSSDVTAALRQHIQAGGVLVIQVDPMSLNITELATISQELQRAIADSNAEPAQRQDLQLELDAIEAEIATALEQIPNQLGAIAQKLGNPLQGDGKCSQPHPLRTSPFVFGQLPTIAQQQLYLLNWDGIVVMVGDLSQHWIGDEQLSREAIRTAQELGTNLLHFAWQRHQKTALTKP
jgi:hypothetical protein